MHPILVQLGPLPVHTFGVLMGSGFLVGILYGLRQARRHGMDPDAIFNLCFWIMISGVLGSRALYIAIDIARKGAESEFTWKRPQALLALWEGGLVWYGGFIAAALVVILYTMLKKMPVWRTCDLLTPATFLGLGMGRIGCLMAGDDFGRIWKHLFAVTFNNPEALVYPPSWIGQPLFPSQLHMSIDGFLVAAVGHLLLEKRLRISGQVFAIVLMLYAILRYIEEMFRGDTERGWVPFTHQTISTSQGIGILVFAAGLALYLARRALWTEPLAFDPPEPVAAPASPDATPSASSPLTPLTP
jgi:phosphatidylglycerol:prolipoprotein diacylglycerol transferase